MDQILLRRSRDEHTPARSSAERIPSHLSVACAEACDIVPPFRCFSLMILRTLPHVQVTLAQQVQIRSTSRGCHDP